MTHSLPDKLSDLILLALTDLELCEASPIYEINMYEWHNPHAEYDPELECDVDSLPCSVCFAGSVMAQTLNTAWDESCVPENFDAETAKKLHVLDAVRRADTPYWIEEVEELIQLKGLPVSTLTIPHYSEAPSGFKSAMRAYAAQLAAAGF